MHSIADVRGSQPTEPSHLDRGLVRLVFRPHVVQSCLRSPIEPTAMKLHVHPTDHDWFRFHRARSPLAAANFWQPDGSRECACLQAGELFLFVLGTPINRTAGAGVYAHSSH